jgi:hypothetical protein
MQNLVVVNDTSCFYIFRRLTVLRSTFTLSRRALTLGATKAAGGCLAIFLLVSATAHAEDYSTLSGRDIMDRVSERHDRPFEYEEQNMVLVDSAGNKEARTLRRYSREIQEGERKGLFKYLVVFDAPAGVNGVALLTWQNKGADDDQWTLLPAQGNNLKRTAKGGKRNLFMGTDFAFEDMTAEDRSKFEYKREADEDIKGQAYFVVDAYPLAEDVKNSTGYQKRRLFIRQDNFFMVRIDYYDRRGKFFKRQINTKLTEIGGGAWRAQRTIMMRKISKNETSKTFIDINKRTFEESDVPAAVFTHRHLTTGKHKK